MTDTSHRMYAVVLALVVFLVSWAAVAARPWAPSTDPRLAALAQREQRLRVDALLVRQVVDQRNEAYRKALQTRQAHVASALQASRRASAPAVRVVNLPPLTITRTS